MEGKVTVAEIMHRHVLAPSNDQCRYVPLGLLIGLGRLRSWSWSVSIFQSLAVSERDIPLLSPLSPNETPHGHLD